ncbi:hypothetical protein [Streptomyces poriferorum]|uniref:hypothetical protein n=1 Tax=Streptomyces poriferorum TaxID=2798799 RepID=UPI00353273AC
MSSTETSADLPGPRTAAARSATPALTWLTPAFMTTASVASLRAAPTMAVYGLARAFLCLLPAILFLRHYGATRDR